MKNREILLQFPNLEELKISILTIQNYNNLNRWDWGVGLISLNWSILTTKEKFISIKSIDQNNTIKLALWEAYLILFKQKIAYPFHLE